MRQQRGRAPALRWLGNPIARSRPAMMLDSARAHDDAVRPQRRAAVHGDGRDGGGGADRGGRRPRHPYGGRPAGGRRADARDRRGAARRSARARWATPNRSAFPRCVRASRGIIRKPIGVPLGADRVIVTTGSSAAFILAFLSMFEPGDRVAIANPGYPPYRHILTALGCEPVLIETEAATRFAITGERLRAAHAKKPLAGVLVASPANPTGTMMTPQALGRSDRASPRSEGIKLDLRRDLSRPRLRHAGRDGGCDCRTTRSSSIRSRNTSA